MGDMEFVVDGCEFSFFCNPYLLKLQFPYPCIDDERAKAVYDMDKVFGILSSMNCRTMAPYLCTSQKRRREECSLIWICSPPC